MKRRHFLASAAALGAAASPLLLTGAQAQAVDYKALVCIFLYGGNDGINMVTPRDATRYGQYAAVRGQLALPQAQLFSSGSGWGVDYGLHPSMSALGTAWTDGALAPVFNVGPLYQPLTKAEFRAAPNNGKIVPDSLFSHSDQQTLWETAYHDVFKPTGWGGRAAQTRPTTVMSVGGNGRFGISELAAPLVLPGPGSGFGIDGYFGGNQAMRRTALDTLYAQADTPILHNAFAGQQRDAFSVATALAPTLQITPGNTASEPINAAFAPVTSGGNLTSGLARQLYQIAKLIEYRSSLPSSIGSTRHVYFATMGGFDTHGDQIAGNSLTGDHANLMKELADASAAFYGAMKTLGLVNNVTTFTQSDFGRTFAPNSSNGTDHAWGNMQLVLGGSVIGTSSYGAYPELRIHGANDVGQDSWENEGRWLPTTSVDQYAATLLRWWGLNEGQIDGVLPNLPNFGSARNVGFMKPA